MKHSMHIFEIKDGVYHVIIDFNKTTTLDSIGDGSSEGKLSLFFSRVVFDPLVVPIEDLEAEYEVVLPLDTDGYIFGDVSKRTYYGTYYTKRAYSNIVTKENEFITAI